MKEVILKVPDGKFRFFMELIKNLGFVTVKSGTNEAESEYDAEFVKQIQKGDKDIAEGKSVRLSVDEFKSLCK